MKKYANVMERVRIIEEKYGIHYAKTSGSLFGTLKVIYTIIFAYTAVINLLYILATIFTCIGNEYIVFPLNSVVTVSVCTAGMIAGFVLLCTKLKITGLAVSIASLPMMLLNYASLLKDEVGFLGYKISFYWRHSVPITLMFVLLVWMLIIAVREVVITNKQYKRVLESIYDRYRDAVFKNDAEPNITDEQWEDFLKNYDPRRYQNQFDKQINNFEE